MWSARSSIHHLSCSSWCSLVPSRLTVVAQEGHPLTGTWTGDVGARHVTLALEWDGKTVPARSTRAPTPRASRASGSTRPCGRSISKPTAQPTSSSTAASRMSARRHERLSARGQREERKLRSRSRRVDSQSTSSNSGDLPANPIYDSSRRVTLRGTVTNVEWINPRVRFAVSVRDPKATQTGAWSFPTARRCSSAKATTRGR